MPSRTVSDAYETFSEVKQALHKENYESSKLILGIDFNIRNQLKDNHEISDNAENKNPYQKCLEFINHSLKFLDDDNAVRCYGFGDETTQDTGIFPFYTNNEEIENLEQAILRYNQIASVITPSKNTSFVNIINESIYHVIETNNRYHILIILSNGKLNQTGLENFANNIEKASKVALSIVLVIIGDKEWEYKAQLNQMSQKRKFDNYHVVNFKNVMKDVDKNENWIEKSEEFSKHAMMAIPSQFRFIKKKGYLYESYRSFETSSHRRWMCELPYVVKQKDGLENGEG